MLSFILFLISVLVAAIIAIFFTVVAIGAGWVLSLIFPLSLFQASTLFVGTAFVVFYIKHHQEGIPRFWPDDMECGDENDHAKEYAAFREKHINDKASTTARRGLDLTPEPEKRNRKAKQT